MALLITYDLQTLVLVLILIAVIVRLPELFLLYVYFGKYQTPYQIPTNDYLV